MTKTHLIWPERRVTRQPLECCCRRGVFIGPELCLPHTATRLCDPKGPTAQLRLGAVVELRACRGPGRGETCGRSHVAGALVNLTDVAALRRRWLLADVGGGFRLGGGPAERLVAWTEATALHLQSAPAAVRSAGATPSLCGYRGASRWQACFFGWMSARLGTQLHLVAF